MTLEASKDQRLLSWSHIYLGRVLDLECKRDAAVAEYNQAMATRDGQLDTRLAAERGLKAAYTVNGHTCDEDSSDDSRPRRVPAAPLPIQPAVASPALVQVSKSRSSTVCAARNGHTRMGEEPATRDLEAVLEHRFRSPALLRCALTHRSLARQLAHDTAAAADGAASLTEDNERLEFLGDAVLNLLVAEALFKMHPEWREGELTRVRAQLVSRQNMARVAEAIGLGDHLRLSKGEERSGLRKRARY